MNIFLLKTVYTFSPVDSCTRLVQSVCTNSQYIAASGIVPFTFPSTLLISHILFNIYIRRSGYIMLGYPLFSVSDIRTLVCTYVVNIYIKVIVPVL